MSDKDTDTHPVNLNTESGILRIALALLAVVALLFLARDVLSPPILFVFAWVVLRPFRDQEGHTALLGILAAITVLWVVATSGGILAPFVVAMGLAYLLDPVVDRLEARGLSRTPAIMVLAIPVAVLLVLGIIFGIPAIGRQTGEVIESLPTVVERLQDWGTALQTILASIPGLGDALVTRLEALDGESLAAMLEARQSQLAQTSWQAVLGVGRGIGATVTFLGYLVLTPVLAFYLLRDWDGLVSRISELLPRDRHDAIADFAREYDQLLGQYLRGQILVAVAMGALTAIGLWAWGLPYAVLIGVFVTIFSVVPYLGLLLSLIPALIVALISANVGASLLGVAVVFIVVQTLEGTVISPRIVGESVGLHPVWIVLALTAGGFYLGFVGLLLGVPIAVGVKLVVLRAVERYRASSLYQPR